VEDSAEIIYNAIPVEGIKCGWEGDFTGGDCATLFQTQVHNSGSELELLAGRRLSVLTDDDLDIDFSVSEEAMEIAGQSDLQNYPLFVYGIAPVFNIPGVDHLILTKTAVAKIFRGCDPSTSTPSVLPSTTPTTSEPSASPVTGTAAPSASPVAETAAPSSQPTTGTPTTPPALCLPGSILYWDDPIILATNPPSMHPRLTDAGKIKVFVHHHAGSATHAFKEALSLFDPDFYTQIGDANDNTWSGTDFERVFGDYGTLRTVFATPGSIGFEDIHQNLRQHDVNQVELVVEHISGQTVYPNSESLFAAFFEIGLSFGNDGNPASMHTVKLTDAVGSRSWPIARIAYANLRTDHTPVNCLARKSGLLSFINFLYTHEGEASNIFAEGLAPLTAKAGEEIIALIREQLKCDDTLVYIEPEAPPTVFVVSEESLHELLSIFVREIDAEHAFDIHSTLINIFLYISEYGYSFCWYNILAVRAILTSLLALT
jgi:ABC-type phosphate transport system substrate-binding protein